jgi:hypothetical protein
MAAVYSIAAIIVGPRKIRFDEWYVTFIDSSIELRLFD